MDPLERGSKSVSYNPDLAWQKKRNGTYGLNDTDSGKKDSRKNTHDPDHQNTGVGIGYHNLEHKNKARSGVPRSGSVETGKEMIS